jgi:hypothetical protein
LKLLDGHLRRDLDPDREVEVEVLDANDAEAQALLLSIDPLAALAQTQTHLHERLRELTPAVDPALEAAWWTAAQAAREAPAVEAKLVDSGPVQFLVLVTCRDERHQVE